MATKNINVLITGNPTSLQGALVAAGRQVDTFKGKVDGMGKTGVQTGKLLQAGMVAGGIAVAAGLAYAVSAASKFDTQMRNVQSITKISEAEFKSLSAAVISISRELPQSAAVLAEGLYDIASSGFAGAEGLQILEVAARAASAGMTETAVSSKAIVAVLNAYGLEAKDAADVSDILFQAVNVGVISFEELSGVIGDVVGTAAAATVEIDEVAAAIATMTLSGVSGAEAGTSLNRVLQSLIDPSEDLAAGLKSVGYESGLTALQTDDLNVVMDKLRIASGGNIETLLKWFPEIRAARGALALMAAEGSNYARVALAIQDAETRAGATTAALNEQMKSASMQFKLFVNNINAGVITLGQKLLPTVIDVMKALSQLIDSGFNSLGEAARRLRPFFDSLRNILSDVAVVATKLFEVAGPAAKAIAGLVVLGVIQFLNTFGGLVEDVTGFLADHEAVVQVIAALYAGKLVVGFLQGAKAAEAFAKAQGILQAVNMRGFFQDLATRVMYLGDALMNINNGGAVASIKSAFSGINVASAVTVGAVAVLIGELVALGKGMDNAKSQAKEMTDEITKDVDFTSYGDVTQRMAELEDAAVEGSEQAGRYGSAWDKVGSTAKGVVQLLTPLENTVLDGGAAADQASDEINRLSESYMRFNRGVSDIGQALGLSRGAIVQAAEDLGLVAEIAAGVDPSRMAEITAKIGEAVLISGQSSQISGMAEALRTVGEEGATAAEKIDAFKGAIDAVLGIELDVFSATTKLQEAIVGLREEIVNGGGFSEFDEAGRKNRETLTGATEDAIKLSEAIAKRDGIEAGLANLNEYRDKLIEIMTQANMSDTEIAALLEQIGLAPEDIEMLFNLSGTKEAQEKLDAMVEEAKRVDALSIKPTVGVQDEATKPLTDVESLMYKVLGLEVKPTIDAETDPAVTKVDSVIQQLIGLGGSIYVPTVDADPEPGESKIGAFVRKLQEVDAKTAMPRVFIGDETQAAIEAINRRLEGIRDKTVYVTTVARNSPESRGVSRWGNIVAYAQGGITPAHITATQMMKYGEPETGGEAYVPRRGDKRRSVGILQEAASWYGMTLVGAMAMAAGGIVSASYRRAPGSVAAPPASVAAGGNTVAYNMFTVNVTSSGNASIDGRKLVQAIRREIRDNGGNVQTALGTRG